jgi:hypothetical protein
MNGRGGGLDKGNTMGRHRLTWQVAVTVAAVGAMPVMACLDLAEEQQVKDLRILAMRVDPPEILYSFLHVVPFADRQGFPLGPYHLTARALVVDPQGRMLQVATRICPESRSDGCAGYQIRQNAAPEEVRAVTPLVQPVMFNQRGDTHLGGEVAAPPWPLTFDQRALDYMLPHDADGNLNLFNTLLFSATPSFVVRAKVADDEEEEVAFKRFQLSLDISPAGLPPQVTEVVEQLFTSVLGLGFCTPDVALAADVQCIKPRKANRNPALHRVLYKLGSSLEPSEDPADVTSGGQLADLAGRIRVAAGSSVRLRPVLGADDHEPYQGFHFDLQSSTISLKNYVEDMAYSWYTTHGTLEAETNEQFTPTPDNVWSVSADAPPGPAWVWLVVRDQRGGVDWRRLDFEVTPFVDGAGGGGGGFGPGGGSGPGGGGGLGNNEP